MRHKSRVAKDKSPTVADLPRACADETAAVEFLEKQRWDGEPACPRCGDTDVYQMKDRKTGERSSRYLWRCLACKDQYTVRIGTVFEDSRIPLMHWCYAFWAACASKKGVSALQIKRQTGLSYKSALFMMHRIRFAMADGPTPTRKLRGVVEADETYVGGKPRYHGKANQGKMGRGTDKAAVVAAVQRGGDVRPAHVERPDSATLRHFIETNISRSSVLMTDEFPLYRKIGADYTDHQTVKHSAKEYVRGTVHTNSIEGFFAIVKRSLYGIHHAVSRKHLHRYLAERAFVYNGRFMDDGARTALAIKKAEGRRLRYDEYLQ